MGKIVDFNNMSQKQKNIFLIIVVIILILLTWIFRIFNTNRKLKSGAVIKNYNEIKDGTYFTTQSSPTYDRKLYWNLNDIINGFIDASNYKNSDKSFSTDNYYDALTSEYKAFLGDRKYLDVTEKFLKKFEISNSQEKRYKMYDIIDQIYIFKDDMYICQLKGTKDQAAYIGIRLNESNKTFEIFYID